MPTDAADEGVRARLAALSARPTRSGWVPPPPDEVANEDGSAGFETGPGAAIRDRAMASALAAYTAAHGHPLDVPEVRSGAARWGTRARVTAVAVTALAALGGLVVVRAANQAPSVVLPLADDAAGSLTTGDPAGQVVVHVVGQVVSPGVVELPGGARVADAIAAVGGVTAEADLTAVNLARVLDDGEQLYVPRPGEAAAVSGTVPTDPRLDLNTADAGALEGLPGIGPVLAQRILDWRTAHGRFTSVEELTEVSGIGPSVLGQVRDLVRVG